MPYDQLPPTVTSGIRIGTPAVTSRGFREPEMEEVAGIILAALRPHTNEADRQRLRRRVEELLAGFPLYPHL